MATLVHPDGKRGVNTDDPTEINNLVLQGYTIQEHRPSPSAPRRAPTGPRPAPETTGGPESDEK